MKPWYLHKPPPSPQKPIQMRPQVPPSNPEKTYRLNAHAQRHGRLGLRFQRLSGGPAASSKSLGGAPTIKDPQRLLLAPRPPSPHPRTAAPSSSAARSPWPRPPFVLCFCVMLCQQKRGTQEHNETKDTHTGVLSSFFHTSSHTNEENKRSLSKVTHAAALYRPA